MSIEIKDEAFTNAGKENGHDGFHDHIHGRQFSLTGENSGLVDADVNKLQRGLSGFHTSMIAIGGAIGAVSMLAMTSNCI